MTYLDFWIRAADVSLFVYVLLLVGIALWSFQGRLPTALQAKYSKGLIFVSKLPFTYNWRKTISAEDLYAFEKARVRSLVFLVAISGGSLVIAIYGYIQMTVLLWKCNMQGAGLLHGQ